MEADRRQNTYNRPHQRLPHHAVRYTQAVLGRKAVKNIRNTAQYAARGKVKLRDIRLCRYFRRESADSRNRRRPAGGTFRAEMLLSGRYKKHLRNRLFFAYEHRKPGVYQRKRAAYDRSSVCRRRSLLCA